MLTGVARAMNFLHSIRIPSEQSNRVVGSRRNTTERSRLLHKFLTGSSVLIDDDLNARVSCPYFGRAITNYQPECLSRMAPYLAPEVISYSRFSEKSDVYSFGIIMFEMASFESPYYGFRYREILRNVIQGHRPDPERIPETCPQAYIQLMQQCWNEDIDARPNFPEILKTLDFLLGQCLLLEKDVGGVSVPTRRSTATKTTIAEVTTRHDVLSKSYTAVQPNLIPNVTIDYHYNAIGDGDSEGEGDDEPAGPGSYSDHEDVPPSYVQLCKDLEQSRASRELAGRSLPPPPFKLSDVDFDLADLMDDKAPQEHARPVQIRHHNVDNEHSNSNSVGSQCDDDIPSHNIKSALHDALCSAALAGDITGADALLRAGANVHIGNDSALRVAARRGDVAMVKLLVSRGADVHADDDAALITASERGHVHVVEHLIIAGANVNANEGRALILAAKNGHRDIVLTLISNGIDLNVYGRVALLECVNHVDIVDVLLSRIETL